MRTIKSALMFVGTIIIPSCLQALADVLAVAVFKSHGLDMEFALFSGGQEWRKSLHDIKQRNF